MKVRCIDCKKRFDYELYSGVCPKCGNYLRPIEMETSENDNCQVESSHVHVESEYTDEQPERKKLSATAVTTMLVVLILLVGIGSMVLAMASQQRAHEAMTVKEEIPIKMQQADEPITYMAENSQFDIYIDLIKVDNNPAYEIPEDYEVVVVSYHIMKTSLGKEGASRDSFYEISMKPYLETKDGRYLEAMSDYDLKEIKTTDYDPTSETGIGRTFIHQKGKLYFLTKKDDVRSLYIVSADYDEEHYQWGALREMIRVEGLEVAR